MRPTTRTVVVGLAAALVAVFVMAGACGPGPCDGLPIPSATEQAENDDIERMVGGTECDFENGAWHADSDLSTSHRSRTSTRTATATRTPSATPTRAPATTTRKR